MEFSNDNQHPYDSEQSNGTSEPSSGFASGESSFSDPQNPFGTQSSEQNTYQQNPYGTPPPMDRKMLKKMQREQRKAARKQDPQRKPFIKILAVCIAVSLIFGTAGGYFGMTLAKGRSGGTAVLYENVELTATDTTENVTQLSVSDVVSLVKDSVVEITTEVVTTSGRMQQYVTEGAGSGVILTTDGYIVTNYHVIEGASSITVTLTDDSTYTATVVGSDETSDIAVLKIEATGLTPAVLGDSDELSVGQTAIVIGNPLGELGGTVTDGIISALDREITIDDETMNLLQIDAAVNPGNSGGGLFNTQGELVGIVNAKSSGTDVEGLGFAIPINNVKTIIDNLISYGYVTGQTKMGVTLIDIEDAQTANTYQVSDYGVYVVGVESGSNADNAGVQEGDRIISVNGTDITSSSQVKSLIKGLSVGDQVTVVVQRSGKQMTLTMTMNETKN
ncbi:MAG: S1C family serine protease [Anaerofustis sp.]